MDIFNFVRALYPNPLACSIFSNKKIYFKKINHKFQKLNYPMKPGTIIEVNPSYLLISTKDKIVKVLDWISYIKLTEKKILN